MPRSLADLSADALSCGEPLPSSGTTSNFGSVGALFALSWVTTSRSCFSEPSPACANGPESTSMKATLTTSWALAGAPSPTAVRMRRPVQNGLRMGVSCWPVARHRVGVRGRRPRRHDRPRSADDDVEMRDRAVVAALQGGEGERLLLPAEMAPQEIGAVERLLVGHENL